MKKNIFDLFILCIILASNELNAQDTILKAKYVYLPYDLVDDESLKLDDQEIESIRNILIQLKYVHFVAFDIKYSEKDSLKSYEKLKNQTKNFDLNNAEDVVLDFATSKRFINRPIDSQISYINRDGLHVAKIIKKIPIADSVKARHIFIANGTEQLIDSILHLLKSNKIEWEKAYSLYNQDPSANDKNGDLGYFKQGEMVEPFDRLCFETAAIGEYNKVKTIFGWHIVQVLDRIDSGESFAFKALSFTMPIDISAETKNIVKQKAIALVRNCANLAELRLKCKKDSIELLVLKEHEFLNFTLRSWTHKAAQGEITKEPILSSDLDGQERYYIAGIEVRKPTDYSQEEIQQEFGHIFNEGKKREILSKSIEHTKSLSKIAQKYDVEVKDISFLEGQDNSYESDQLAHDPTLYRELFKYKPGQFTKPILGSKGIFIAQILWKKYK